MTKKQKLKRREDNFNQKFEFVIIANIAKLGRGHALEHVRAKIMPVFFNALPRSSPAHPLTNAIVLKLPKNLLRLAKDVNAQSKSSHIPIWCIECMRLNSELVSLRDESEYEHIDDDCPFELCGVKVPCQITKEEFDLFLTITTTQKK